MANLGKLMRPFSAFMLTFSTLSISSVSRHKIQPKLRHRSHLSTKLFILYEESWQKLSWRAKHSFQTRPTLSSGRIQGQKSSAAGLDLVRRQDEVTFL